MKYFCAKATFVTARLLQLKIHSCILLTYFCLVLLRGTFAFPEQYLYPESNIKQVKYYLKQQWKQESKSYQFLHEIKINKTDDKAELLKSEKNYYEVFYNINNEVLFSKKWVNNKIHAQFFFKKGLISHYFYYIGGEKVKTIFFNKRQIKTKAFYYDVLSKNINKKIFFRKNGKSILKKEVYDHQVLREEYIYYPNNKLRSHTEFFEGKKKYYDKNEKLTKTERFKPKKLYQK